jgi:phosphoglycerate dehydrogenase-like enzyme
VKIFMIGEAARHRETLAGLLPKSLEIIALPQAAGTKAEFDSAIGASDVVITMRLARPNAAMPRFGLLHLPGAGIDGIDVAALHASTWVCNVFEHELPIAEYAVLAMLHWVVGLDDMRARFTAETWASSYRARVPHHELAGRTVGVIGYGRIGQLVARKAAALDMRVIALTRKRIVGDAAVSASFGEDERAEFLGQCDFIVVCCPLNDTTRGMLGVSEFDAMKDSAVLINVARAEIAEEQALYEALRDRRIAGAYLDVWYAYPSGPEDNPAPSRFPFGKLPNVVGTPHSSAWTTDLPRRRYGFIARNIQRYLDGQPLENVVRAGLADAAAPHLTAGASA